jgi:ABC-type transport system involved in cytochrome c biogenesis ATPase subunit/GNAT superfamily N-acetyltransferase
MLRHGNHYVVRSALPKGHVKKIMLETGAKTAPSILVPRFALLGKGDEVQLISGSSKRIGVVPYDGIPDSIPVMPSFAHSCEVRLGTSKLPLSITEVTTPTDLAGLTFLQQFHYKTNAKLKGDDPDAETPSDVGGRRGVLYASIRTGQRWQPAGYIELQMPLMMCKPRHNILDAPFKHPTRPVAWSSWNQHTIKEHLNVIVRIGRVVVSPELRGLGLARLLIEAAKTYAQHRWHIGGRRPLFMEISAEMLNHVDFVTSSGFIYAGHTEGNISRVVKDMEAMARDPQGKFGMMSLQRKYLRTLQDYCSTLGISFKQGLALLKKKIQSHADNHTSAEWAAMRSIVRPPIPYYLCGLDDHTSEYLSEAAKQITIDPSPTQESKPRRKVAGVNISLSSLSVRATYPLPQTRATKVLIESFGLAGDTIVADLVSKTSVKASSGNIILVVGPSGSGKSVFLRALDPAADIGANLKVTLGGHRKYTAGWLQRLRDDLPLFEALSERHTPSLAFSALSRVGLAEAFAFIKPFWMLSRGQQYRALMADLLLRDDSVWLLDEFGSDLDALTARIVAHNLRKQVVATGRIAFIAAANHTHFIEALRPTQIVYLRSGDKPRWMSLREYRDDFFNL